VGRVAELGSLGGVELFALNRTQQPKKKEKEKYEWHF